MQVSRVAALNRSSMMSACVLRGVQPVSRVSFAGEPIEHRDVGRRATSAGSVEMSAVTPARSKTSAASCRDAHARRRSQRCTPRRARPRSASERYASTTSSTCRIVAHDVVADARASAPRRARDRAARARRATAAEYSAPWPTPEWLKLRVQTTRDAVAAERLERERLPAPPSTPRTRVSGRCSAVSSSGISAASCRPYCSALPTTSTTGSSVARRAPRVDRRRADAPRRATFTSYARAGIRRVAAGTADAGEVERRRRAGALDRPRSICVAVARCPPTPSDGARARRR